MSIQELYIFACKNDLLQEDVYKVINKFNKSLKQNSTNADSLPLCSLFDDKVEWSFEDLFELFSK